MSKHFFVLMSVAAIMISAGGAIPSTAGVKDLPGIETAASMKEWLKLTDDQVTKLTPVITTRIDKVDGAIATVEAAEEPDAMGFIKEYGEIQKEFNAGVTNILTPDQLKRWDSFKVELEKSMSSVMSPDQLTGYEAIKEEKKKAMKGKK